MAKVRPRQQRGTSGTTVTAQPFRSVSTASLPKLLHHLGSTLVLSTYQTARVVLVHARDASSINTHFAEYERAMGIAVGPHRMAIGCARAVWDFRNQPHVAPLVDPAGTFDAAYLPRRIHFTGHIGVHEIAFAGDELWIVNTAFSALCTLDDLHSVVPRWRPPFISAITPEDRCHMNGLAIVDDRVAYVTAFSETDFANGWRNLGRPGGVIIDVAANEIVSRGLVLPHSPRWYDGRLWVLESGKGTLATIDLRDGSPTTVAEVPGFARGLAFSGPYAFIGLSRVRESSILGDMPLLHRVPASERACGVWVVDVRDGSFVAFLRFEEEVQEIFDVQVLHGIRHPALLDTRAPELGVYVIVPDPARPGAPVGMAHQVRMKPDPAGSLSVPMERRALSPPSI